ncbi:mesocentin-like [Lytechinus variegatus]|uniref:mesocentin-like n=1 Tax=Lytechinus variegatus TaxID=7654 RepID=UPI001BB11E3D|nr:mesocentin-like [Lytechinus variegatus]
MANNIVGDWSEELPVNLTGQICPEHDPFKLDFFCKECKREVCVRCVAFHHSDHGIEYLKDEKEQLSELGIEHLKDEKEQLSELRKELGKKKEDVKCRKKYCEYMLTKVHEKAEEDLCSIDQDRDRRRSSVQLTKNDFERRIKGCIESLEKEEDRIYALEFSSEAVLLRRQGAGDKNTLGDTQEDLRKCISAPLPRVKTYNDLKSKFRRIVSPNRFSSSSSSTSSTSLPFSPEDSSILEETGTLFSRGSAFDNFGAAGGLVFKCDRQEEVFEGCDLNSRRDDLVLSELVSHLLPEHLTPLGLNLGVGNPIIAHIVHNNPRDIGKAIFQVLKEWKRNLCTEVLMEGHFKTLEECLRKIKNDDAADWLTERMKDSADQPMETSSSCAKLVQPSSSPGKLMPPPSSADPLVQPSPSPVQLVLPSPSPVQFVQQSSSPGQLVQPSSSPGQLVQPSSSPGQLVQPSSSSGQFVQPSLYPGQLVEPSPSHGQLVQPSSCPGQLVLPTSSPGQLVQPSSSPGQLVKPFSSPGQLVQPFSSPGQLVQPSSSSGHLVQPSPSPGQLVQPSPSHGRLVQPSSSSGHLVQPSPSPVQLVQPSPSPDQLVQPSPSPVQLVQPSSSSGQLVQRSSSLGQLVQPSLSPGQIVQPSSSPGQLVQPSSSPGQLVQPSSSSASTPPVQFPSSE